MTARLPAHLEIAGLIRLAQAGGGFASVLRKGDRDAGAIVLILTERGANPRIFERMPSADGHRKWQARLIEAIDNSTVLDQYLDLRKAQDPDLWILELDIANGERLIGLS